MSDLLRGTAPMTMARSITGSYLPPIYRGQLVRERQIHPDDLKRLTEWGYLTPAEDGDGHSAVTGAALPPVIGHDDEVFLVDHPSAAEPVLTTGPERQSSQDAAKAKADDEAEQRRSEARTKLEEIGGTPDGRSSDAVMVEYLVKNGYDRAEAEKADRNQLKQLVTSVGK